MKSEVKELLPCPFCGGKASPTVDVKFDYSTSVDCVQCGASTTSFETLDSAIGAWNTRQPSSTWTSVEDALPEEKGSGHPLIVTGENYLCRPFVQGDAWFDEGHFWEWGACNEPMKIFGVTHWRHLPPPPQMKGEKG